MEDSKIPHHAGYTMGAERIQEEARTTKDNKLDGHREKHGHHLGRSQGTSG